MSLFLKLPRCGVHMTRGEWAAGAQDWKGKTLGGDQLLLSSMGAQQADKLGWDPRTPRYV